MYTWGEAYQRCNSRRMRLVSLDNPDKDYYISSEIDKYRIEFIWTSGRRGPGGQFVWGHGGPVGGYTNWGRTGGAGTPQPDNREGREECLAVLNRFYPGDGITWHDIACHHKKHFVCEHY
ncbi:perlucin-like [Amphibalanus amphitrite]|uniref:perlucin-like n=1 Tax=Amphibalanus amphitrite TaxID=1232801 RepID=UPI001C92AB11|nr:perlucin-like [Amphibalanus amphitrite]